jgi:tRNA (guanine6-N2)-methyltransferase
VRVRVRVRVRLRLTAAAVRASAVNAAVGVGGAPIGFAWLNSPVDKECCRDDRVWKCRHPSSAMTVRLLARCVRGLEWIAAAEVADRVIDPGRITMGARDITFGGASLTPALLGLRTVDDLFIEVGAVTGVGTTKDVAPVLAKRLAALDWARWPDQLRDLRPVPHRPKLDVVVSLEGRRNYNRYAVENAVGPLLARQWGAVYLPRTADAAPAGEADLTVRVLVRGSEAVAALRVSARPLHRRPYKQDTAAGTLHPPVAAGLSRLAGPGAGDLVIDPFCGDGTIAIETALSFPGTRVSASDLDPTRLANAKRNAARAEVDVSWNEADAGRVELPEHAVAAVITNPPWNVAVDARGSLGWSLEGFWRRLGNGLAQQGRASLIADLDLGAPDQLRRLGYDVALASQIRLAGRVSQVILAAPPGCAAPRIPAGLRTWRDRALSAGVVTAEGF